MPRFLKIIFHKVNKKLFTKTVFLFFLNITLFAQNGIIKSFYGPKQLREQLSFANDVLNGACFWYYENGNLKSEKTFSNGKLHGLVKEFQENGLLTEEYYVNYGIKDGVYKSYWGNGALKEVRTYNEGILVKKVTIDYDPFFVPPVKAYAGASNSTSKPKEEIICDADICASPIGGTKAIEERIIYPEEAKLYGLEGIVTLVVTVNVDGFVDNVLVLKGIGLGCDEAAVDAVKKSRFLPGQSDGKIVKSNLTIDLVFSLKAAEKDEVDLVSRQQKYDVSEPVIESLVSNEEMNDAITYYKPKQNNFRNNSDTDLNSQDNSSNLDQKDVDGLTEDLIGINDVGKKRSDIKKSNYINFSCNVDKCPEPKGGMASIMAKFKVPSKAKELKLYGDIVVSAEIDKYGNVRNTRVLKDIGYGCDIAAEVAVLDTKFNPGKINGERVDSELIIIIPVRPELN